MNMHVTKLVASVTAQDSYFENLICQKASNAEPSIHFKALATVTEIQKLFATNGFHVLSLAEPLMATNSAQKPLLADHFYLLLV